MKKIAFAAIAAAAVIVSVAPASAKCKRAGGEGTAITNELATLNAKDALAQSIAASGAKAKGKVTVSCKYDLVISTCKATQKICK